MDVRTAGRTTDHEADRDRKRRYGRSEVHPNSSALQGRETFGLRLALRLAIECGPCAARSKHRHHDNRLPQILPAFHEREGFGMPRGAD
jgi:hypothetical protein